MTEREGKRKVLHITYSLNVGGMQRAIYQLVKHQCKSGMGADVLVSSNAGGYYGSLIKELGITVYELNARSGMNLLQAVSFLKIIKRYDILHFHAPNPILMIAAAFGSKTKLTYTYRSGIQFPTGKRRVMYLLTGWVLRNYFQRISANTLHGCRSAARIFSFPGDQIHLTYNGIEFDLLQANRSAREVAAEIGLPIEKKICVLGTCANLRPWKRIELLLEAFARLNKDNAYLLVIGYGLDRHRLELISEKLSISDKVIFTGKQVNVSNYLQLLDIFVLPSDNTESFGNALVEAMAQKIPAIIMKDGGGMIEHFPSNLRAFPEDLDGLCAAMIELYDSSKLRQNFGAELDKYVREKYSLTNMLESYESLYDQI